MPEDPIEPLSRREGRAVPGGPYEGVPEHLEGPLRRWARRFLDGELEERVALRLGVALPERGRVPRASRPTALVDQEWVDLLDVVDVALQADGRLAQQVEREHVDERDDTYTDGDRGRLHQMHKLEAILRHADSVYRVDEHAEPVRLIRRLDPAVETAGVHAITTAAPTAGDHLHNAWVAAYARDPQPDSAYDFAVRAVEVAISSVVSPKNDRQTLGTAVRDLRSGAHNYELVLLDKAGDGSVEPLLLLLERLWEGQKSRHGAGYGARPSTLEEARAAVQISVLVVQWLSDGALRRRGGPGTP